MILSGMLLPLDEGPRWMQALGTAGPLSHVVEAQRALFAGEFGTDAAHGLLAASTVAVMGQAVAVRAMHRG